MNTTVISRPRRTAAVGVVLLATSVLAACGGGEKSASDEPAATASATPSSTSATPSPSATPKPTPTARPLSRFENTPQVKVARAWAAAAARSSTAGDKSMRRTKPFLTPTGLTRMQGYFAEDIGNIFRGPVPFTPVAVRAKGGTAEVPMCMWTGGFSLDPKTKKPADARRIDAGTFQMVRSGGKWKINDMVYATHSCKTTSVKGRPF